MRSLAIYFALFVVSAVVVIGVFPTPVRAEADGGDQVQIEDRSPRIRRLSLSEKFKFWFNRDRDSDNKDKKAKKTKNNSFKDKLKAGWKNFKNWVKKYKTNKIEAYKIKKESLRARLESFLRQKLNRGKKLTQGDMDQAAYEHMRKQRRGFTVTDAIFNINKGNDLNLKQMDIVEEADAPQVVQQSTGRRQRRDVMREKFYLWHSRIIPYEIDASLAEDVSLIEKALGEIQSKTCLRFVKRTTQKNWLRYFSGKGCYSNVGKVFWKEGAQDVSIGKGCRIVGTIQHETMHALGFYHEQARPDRDQYVKIYWDNIPDDQEFNFEKQELQKAETLNIQYDFSSIMHYGKYAFAIDPSKPTIVSIADSNQKLGQRDGVSPIDIQQINILYSCAVSTTGWSAWSYFGACSVDCVKKRSRFCMDPNDKTSCPNPTYAGYARYGVDLQSVRCSATECQGVVDGNWAQWGDWSECSQTCGQGTHTRQRTCSNPAPKNGGKSCDGLATNSQKCLLRQCNAGQLDCTFEVNTCGWTADPTGNFEWTRKSGGTPSSSTGPSSDHTSGTGSYMYIETSAPAQVGWKARLLSPELAGGSQKCMKFAYHMYGASMGSLRVIIKDLTTKNARQVFLKQGDQLNEWKTGQVTVNNPDKFQIMIEGERGSSWQGDLAIDDVEFIDGPCPEPVATTTPSSPTILRVGCFRDNGFINGARPFTAYADLSGMAEKTDQVSELTKHYYEIVNYCASLARSNGYKFFALQEYYTCWTGPTDKIQYSRDGESGGCWPEKDMNYGQHIVGQHASNMVYQWSDM